MTESTQKLRNICVLAHVDHGKTTLCDHLISGFGNRLIHPTLAGRTRYMDFLEEEYNRGITIKSPSIAIHYRDHTVTVIDSPGHIDFCNEVSTAARLSDGALIIVDAVEGVRIQTHAVLRQVWIEKLTPCLVINKIDRLISDLKMCPVKVYERLLQIVDQVNNIVSGFKYVKYFNDVEVAAIVEDDDDELMFQPQKGNVAFVCAVDGWGFTIPQFAQFFAKKYKWSNEALEAFRKDLWGPKFVKFVLGQIWEEENVGFFMRLIINHDQV